jgi:hypothetical protein
MARRSKRSTTRKLFRVPQKAVNTALGIAKSTRKGTVRIARRAGKGAYGITRQAIGTTRNIGKATVGTLGNVGVRTTKGVTKVVKNSINLASNLTTGLLKQLTRGVNGKRRRSSRRRGSRRA